MKRRQKGMSILESVIAMSIFVILSMGSITVFMSLLNAQKKVSIAQETQQSGREALDVITKLTRNATDVTIPGAAGVPEIGNQLTLTIDVFPTPVTISTCSVGSLDRALCIGGNPILPYDRIAIDNLRFSKNGRILRVNLDISQRATGASPFEEDSTNLETSVILEKIP